MIDTVQFDRLIFNGSSGYGISGELSVRMGTPKKVDTMVLNENEFFRQATRSLFSSLDIETSMQRCLDFLKPYVPVSGLSFSLYDPELNIGKTLASIGPVDYRKTAEIIPFPMEFWDYIKTRWSEGSGVRTINDIDLADEPAKSILSLVWPPDVSLLLMKLDVDRKRLGSLQLFVKGKNRYTDHHAHLISLLHEPFATAIANILQHEEIRRLNDMLVDQNRYLHREMLKLTGDAIIGANFGLRQVMQMVRQVAPMDTPVLLMGETGVGKEIIANAIHDSSQRQGRPFIKVNCGGIPDTLIDSDLFGHEKGAFTGAVARKPGHFERAHTGTIFLDEVGELPSAAQVRLLRVLQHHEINRVGGTESIPVDVRIISATHRNLEEMVQSGRFRRDLWFRINLFPIVIPPLRQRTEDIPALVAYFLDRKGKKLKIRIPPSLAPGALEQLQAYPWPGNVRELENLLERALILNQSTGSDGLLRFSHLLGGPAMGDPEAGGNSTEPVLPLEDVIAAHIQKALNRTGGRVEGKNGSAQMLGINPSTLRGRMRRLGIPYGKKR
jgi:transcriptional regulator with GAF, ATPase, and Fis domain